MQKAINPKTTFDIVNKDGKAQIVFGDNFSKKFCTNALKDNPLLPIILKTGHLRQSLLIKNKAAAQDIFGVRNVVFKEAFIDTTLDGNIIKGIRFYSNSIRVSCDIGINECGGGSSYGASFNLLHKSETWDKNGKWIGSSQDFPYRSKLVEIDSLGNQITTQLYFPKDKIFIYNIFELDTFSQKDHPKAIDKPFNLSGATKIVLVKKNKEGKVLSKDIKHYDLHGRRIKWIQHDYQNNKHSMEVHELPVVRKMSADELKIGCAGFWGGS